MIRISKVLIAIMTIMMMIVVEVVVILMMIVIMMITIVMIIVMIILLGMISRRVRIKIRRMTGIITIMRITQKKS